MRDESIMWAAATETAERIGRVVSDALRTLSQAGVDAAIVEGSALSAELHSSDEMVRRFASRASLSVRHGDVTRAERALIDEGWQPTIPQGDVHLLRAAWRHGRHVVFALLDESSDGTSRQLHPAHPDAVRMRHERLSQWRLQVRSTFGMHQSHVDDVGRIVTETFELGLVGSESLRRQVP